MSYTPTVWREHSMDTTAKLAGLNNLEGMYSEGLSYIDAITHSSSYYTESQCNSKYFTSANDGTGSGLICATLDGYTAQQIMDAGTPAGVIAIWSGTEASIPSGWHLCDGSSGTPNLRDKFIVGAGSNYVKGETGGANTCTTSATITVAGHALTAAETALHSHGGFTDNYPTTSYNSSATGSATTIANSAPNVGRYTGYAGSGSSHDHTASFTGTSNQDKRPPFMARCYIMRV
jgi:hypothetical protein